MVFREQDKHFIWSLLTAAGLIFVWKGLWEGIYYIPYIGLDETAPWVFLFFGFAILTFSGLIFREFDPLGSLEVAISRTVRKVHTHPKKKEFRIKYKDKLKKGEVTISAGDIKKIERGSLILKGRREIFIPAHRITEITHKGKTYWKL